MSTGSAVNLVPTGMVARMHLGDQLTLLHTKYLSSWPHGFREEDFLKFFPLYMVAIFGHGKQNSNPIGPKNLCSLYPHLVMLHMKLIKIGHLV